MASTQPSYLCMDKKGKVQDDLLLPSGWFCVSEYHFPASVTLTVSSLFFNDARSCMSSTTSFIDCAKASSKGFCHFDCEGAQASV